MIDRPPPLPKRRPVPPLLETLKKRSWGGRELLLIAGHFAPLAMVLLLAWWYSSLPPALPSGMEREIAESEANGARYDFIIEVLRQRHPGAQVQTTNMLQQGRVTTVDYLTFRKLPEHDELLGTHSAKIELPASIDCRLLD